MRNKIVITAFSAVFCGEMLAYGTAGVSVAIAMLSFFTFINRDEAEKEGRGEG